MTIRILVPLAGDAFALAIGDVVDHYDSTEAQRWVDAGFAEDAGKAKATVTLRQPEVQGAIEVETIEIQPDPPPTEVVETAVDSTPTETR